MQISVGGSGAAVVVVAIEILTITNNELIGSVDQFLWHT